MERSGDHAGMLDLMLQPAFSVEDGVIIYVNHGASSRMISAGTPVASLLHAGQEEYDAFDGGCLYLTLCVQSQQVCASVSRINGCDIFVLEEDTEPQLQALALAAQSLRTPLANAMNATAQLLDTEDPQALEQVGRINRDLYQMLRLLCNMSDASRYTDPQPTKRTVRNICSILDEVFDKASALAEQAGIKVRFRGLSECIDCLVDEEKLERAVYNLISNAISFSSKGDTVDAQLIRRGKRLYLTVEDSGTGIPASLRGNLFSRYLRQPGLEDSRCGIGLGMSIVRGAAMAHGGTVLMEQPAGKGTRITMTLAIEKYTGTDVRSPLPFLSAFDYAGGLDHGLVELSQHLPPQLYQE